MDILFLDEVKLIYQSLTSFHLSFALGFCVAQNYDDISRYRNSPYRDKIEPLREPFDISKYQTRRNNANYVEPLPIQDSNVKGEVLGMKFDFFQHRNSEQIMQFLKEYILSYDFKNVLMCPKVVQAIQVLMCAKGTPLSGDIARNLVAFVVIKYQLIICF